MSTKKRPTVSACIICYNEEIHIRTCLESVKWCDEIIIVDSFSTDNTIAICKKYTDKIYQREYKGNIDQKNYAMSLTTQDWVLSLDADECVRPELQQEIIDTLAHEDAEVNGYYFKRRAYLFGQWVKHCGWYPDYKLRLFRRGHGYFGGREPHDQFIVKGNAKKMKGAIDHFTYKTLKEYVLKIERYSYVAAQRLKTKNPILILFLMIVKPSWKFFNFYILKRGFLDGKLGLLISCLSAMGNGLKYAYLLDKRLGLSTRDPEAKLDE